MAAKRKLPPKRPAQRAAKRKIASAPAAEVAALNPGAPFELKPEEIERSLVTGENRQLLERYFGVERYAELQDLARKASARSVRGGARVYIVPGIMGSTLGSPRPFFLDDVVWIDPIDIAFGKLTALALQPGPMRHQALGVILLSYLKLKLTLRIAGYDAEFFPYDWRLSMDEVGKRLGQQLAKDRAAKIGLVAHSMGGLVARAALAQGAGKKIERLIMLGTPNHGSFNAVQALRGVYSVIRKLTQIDLHHTPEELTATVFNTFPGLYQLLPDPAKFSAVDLYDAPSWPTTAPGQPRPALLKTAKGSQSFYAAADDRFFLIAGINQETIVDVARDGEEFVYKTSDAGDGTVPVAFAELPGMKTFYVEESHGSLPNNGAVGRAVKDLLGTGTTDALPQQWTSRRAAATRSLTEEQMRTAVPQVELGAAVSDREVRNLLEEIAAPGAREEAVPRLAETGFAHRFDRVVVGRQRQRRLDLRLALGSITEANSHAYVLGIFRDVTPTGAAQAIDERLDGAIAEFSRRRMFSGNIGEVFVLPTGCHPLRPDTVLLAGLGSFDQFNDEVLQLVAENVIRTFIRTGVEDFATVLLGGGSGSDPAATLHNLLTGFLRGLADSDTPHDFRRVTICEMDPQQYARIKEELYRLASTDLFLDFEVTFEEVDLPAPLEAVTQSRGLRRADDAPLYLLVRHEDGRDGETEFVSSVLTAGGKATVLINRTVVPKDALSRELARLEPAKLSFDAVEKAGQALGKLVLGEDFARVLSQMKGRHLVVVHDAIASRIPWETLNLNAWQPALDCGLSRRYLAENLSIAKWLEERRHDTTLNILLVVNPTGDLNGAVKEGARVRELFAAHPSVKITERRESQATKSVLLDDFRSGQYDVLHYAGHAGFDRAQPSRSGILCHGGAVLSGADLASLGKLPSLIFFNACESGRVRKAGPTPKSKRLDKRIAENVGLAEAFLRGGAANYIGTYWPVGDDSAKSFAETFYTEVMGGSTLGAALLAGRKELQRQRFADWADYVLYGSSDFALKQRPAERKSTATA